MYKLSGEIENGDHITSPLLIPTQTSGWSDFESINPVASHVIYVAQSHMGNLQELAVNRVPLLYMYMYTERVDTQDGITPHAVNQAPLHPAGFSFHNDR